MEIKKISDKLALEVEAQCKHGESSSKGGCHADCKKTRWTSANAIYARIRAYQQIFNCRKQTYYTCSWTCMW